MNFFEKLIELYMNIKFPSDYQEISKVDKNISWYLSDSSNQYITTNSNSNNYVIEFDTHNAYATICNNIFEPDNKFLIEMNSIKEKKPRNIFIATQLRNSEELRRINMICKIIIMGIMFECGEENLLLELKKDGAVIYCTDIVANNLYNLTTEQPEPCGKFSEFILSRGFTFHLDYHNTYIRCNKTSYFWKDNELIIKGMYKYIPKKLIEVNKNILANTETDLIKYFKIYSQKYFNIIYLNNLNEIIENYYMCQNNKYLDANAKYVNKLKDAEINPRMYLKIFIYPIILSKKI